MTQMTPEARRNAQIELRDMATDLERSNKNDDRKSAQDKWRRAQFLRSVAAELDNVPEIQ